jgi:hypothetical protein
MGSPSNLNLNFDWNYHINNDHENASCIVNCGYDNHDYNKHSELDSRAHNKLDKK